MDFPQLETVKVSQEDNVGVISLNRPDRLNAMNSQLVYDVRLAFDWINSSDDIQVIIFRGEGRAFCAGDDRKDHQHPDSIDEAAGFVKAIQAVTSAIIFGPKLVVGEINGWAVGGGFEWAINCDFSFWSKTARAFFPEVSLNLFVTGAVTSLLPAMVGLNKAREMLLLGDQYDADTLRQMGLAYKIVDENELKEQVFAFAKRLAALPPKSSQAMKKALNKSAMMNLSEALDLETELTVSGFMDPETTRYLKEF
ncbi:MAG: enoyl-CoA hydratase/carnithine racemase [Gammaproteobacteria bacterium]|jgi:enoyl-CoA hydratase/carnithine racemase